MSTTSSGVQALTLEAVEAWLRDSAGNPRLARAAVVEFGSPRDIDDLVRRELDGFGSRYMEGDRLFAAFRIAVSHPESVSQEQKERIHRLMLTCGSFRQVAETLVWMGRTHTPEEIESMARTYYTGACSSSEETQAIDELVEKLPEPKRTELQRWVEGRKEFWRWSI